tara:strand:+ start:56 stop:274 length:219 start_codon:yes stop_codon:yes gene_type:complete
MTGLLDAMTEEEIGQYPRDGWANVNDSPEVREFLSNLPYEQLIKIEAFRQKTEESGQSELFEEFINNLMLEQ